MTDFFRPTPFRQALTFALAVSLSTAVAVGLIYRSIAHTIEVRREVIVADETAAMLSQSRERIAADLDNWLRNGLLLYSVVGIFDANSTYLAGNLGSIPNNLPLDGKVHNIELPSGLIKGQSVDAPAVRAFVSGTRRGDGTIVVFGRTLTEIPLLRGQLYDLGLYGITGLLVLSLAYGLWANARQSSRLRAIQQAFARIMEGALHERLPVSGRRDDLDRLVGDVNRMLDMVDGLLAEVKNAGDNIAHDLRTPLAIVRTRLERAVTGDADAASLRATMSGALLELDRASRTISALLRLAEIENGQRRSGFKSCDLVQLCRDAADFYEPLAEMRSISLVLDAPGELRIMGDEDLLTEALNNLIDNAIKFSPDQSAISISAVSAKGEICIAVRDEGSGIADDERERIGRRFYRPDVARQAPGSGLGLSLVKAIAKLHEFRVEIDGARPSGTIVRLVRPT